MTTITVIKRLFTQLILKRFITPKQGRYLMGELNPRPHRFYILPKIHKPPEKWTIPNVMPPGRPIVSDCGSETYHSAEYIEPFPIIKQTSIIY